MENVDDNIFWSSRAIRFYRFCLRCVNSFTEKKIYSFPFSFYVLYILPLKVTMGEQRVVVFDSDSETRRY